MIEEWRDVVGYDGIYKISSLGRVISLKFNKEKVLKQSVNNHGYSVVSLQKDGIGKTRAVHQLVAESFLLDFDNSIGLVVDHINNIKSDNRCKNLQYITHRLNVSKDIKNVSSKYTGVCWHKASGKWESKIQSNGHRKHLGLFESYIEASKAYEKYIDMIKLKTLTKK